MTESESGLRFNRVIIKSQRSRRDRRVRGRSGMLLMLPAANRQDKQTLRLFKDRGDVRGFFPEEGDQEAQQAMLEQVPNLGAYTPKSDDLSLWPMVKDSLGNALWLIRPVVVMDEGQKAVAELASGGRAR